MRGWRSVRRAGVLALAVMLVVSATGCQEAYRGKPTGAKVAVVGDSISSNPWYAYDNIHRAFEAQHRVSVSGVPATSLLDSVERVKEYVPMTPRAVVIALGTNDVTQAAGGETAPWSGQPKNPPEVIDARLGEAAGALRSMIDALPGPACIVVVNVGGHPGFPWYHRVAAHWNHDVLPTVTAGDPRVRIADWAKVVDDHYATSTEPIITGDLVHPNEKGQDMLAALMVREVDICLWETMAGAQS